MEGELIVLEHTGLISSLRRRKVNTHLRQSRSANISWSPGEEPAVLAHAKSTGPSAAGLRPHLTQASFICVCAPVSCPTATTLSLPPP